jgi:DNA polymerase III delta prime subunit
MTDDLTSCLKQMRTLLDAPGAGLQRWTLLAEKGLLLRGLDSGVRQIQDEGAGAQMEECVALLEKPALDAAIEIVLTQRGIDKSGAGRLARHARALAATAMAARSARLAAAGTRAGSRTVLESNIGKALALLDNGARSARPCRAPFFGCGVTPGYEVREALQRLAAGRPQIAAHYWILYWLDRAAPASPSLPDLVKETMPVWLVSAGGTDGGSLHQMHLTVLAEATQVQLFEHPESALAAFGPRLLATVRESWERLESKPALCWRLPDQGALLDGDSLGGAVSLAMLALADGSHYRSDCVVLGRITEERPNPALEPVAGLGQKLDAIDPGRIRTVVLGAGTPGEPVASRSRVPLSDAELAAYADAGLQLVLAGNLEECARLARGWEDPGPAHSLGGYKLVRTIPADPTGRTWQVEKDDSRWLLKHWPYTELDETVWRTSWDRELRALYRVCTSARAEKSLITLKDATVDGEHKSFVMVFGAEGFETLDALLKNRGNHRWLRPDTLRMSPEREPVWRALRALAEGISLLHSQRVLHRNVCAERVYVDPRGGPPSMRLGGFEWSVRLGSQFGSGEIRGWAVPPECACADARYTLDMDWYGFGMLAARCFYALESLGSLPPSDLNRAVNDAVRRDTGMLSPKERNLLRSFLEFEREDRLRNVDEILPALDEIVSLLATGATPDDVRPPLCVVFNHKNAAFQMQLENHGFQPDPEDAFMPFSPEKEAHCDELRTFLQRQFAKPILYASLSPAGLQYHLVGLHLAMEIVSEGYDDPPTWEFAAAKYVGSFTVPPEAKRRRLEGLELVFLLAGEQSTWYSHQNWKLYLPRIEAEPDVASLSIQRFKRFLRYTNQLELLMRYAEIFPCTVEVLETGAAFCRVKLIERAEPGRVPRFCEGDGGMAEFFQREKDDRNKDGVLAEALLTRHDELLPEGDGTSWIIEQVQLRDEEHYQAFVILTRTEAGGGRPPQGDFYVRVPGYKGQVKLVERRRRAIDRLEDHTYLLKTLIYPSSVWMDTRQPKLNYEPDEKRVDRFKQAVMKDILRSRPIYALQGPPGTGKTTLVAHLMREILKDDPAAQILVTAQAHGAVDVLRQKVTEAFQGVALDDQPVTVRLGEKRTGTSDRPSEVEEEARRILQQMRDQFRDEPSSEIERQWTALLDRMAAPSREGKAEDSFWAFVELIRVGANIVYCTTSAGDLEELVDENLSFDWAVLEEAGKIHGFDLALPMHAGHRWLLVGDQDQLAPYRIEDFELGIGRDFSESAECIARLSRRQRNLVDSDWRDAWLEMNPPQDGTGRKPLPELGRFQEFSKAWVRTFDRLYKTLKNVTSDSKVTRGEESEGATVGFLSRQYRMHPTIGDLISETFYNKGLHSQTQENGVPLDRVCHGFAAPEAIREKAVVWIDVPWCHDDRRRTGEEQGPPRYNRYSNLEEVRLIGALLDRLEFERPPDPERPLSLALLSPYSQQVTKLGGLQNRLPKGMTWQETIYARRDRASTTVSRPSHTVDSFQGNQASVVVVSLVRNNTKDKIDGLGFLKETKRMNVLLSRAERLLVLVGSWEFFQYQMSGFSEKNQQHLTFGALRTAFDVLERMFKDGRAVRIRLQGIRFEKVEAGAAGGRS